MRLIFLRMINGLKSKFFLVPYIIYSVSFCDAHFSLQLYRKSEVAKEAALKPPAARVVFMHVLHHTSVKLVAEEWKAKPLWIRYFTPPPHPSFSLHSLIFDFPPAVPLTHPQCERCIVPLVLNMTRKAWKNNVWGLRGEWDLFVLCFIFGFSRWQWCSLKTDCRCATNCQLILYPQTTVHKHVRWDRTDVCVYAYTFT